MPHQDRLQTRAMRADSLAMKMIAEGVKAKTISAWTGLRDGSVRKLVGTYRREFPGFKVRAKRPGSLSKLLRSPRMRGEFAAAAGLCRALGVIPKGVMPDARRRLPSLERGEQVCETYGAYVDVVPHSGMSLEMLMSVLVPVAAGDWEIGGCGRCGVVMLVQPVGRSRRACVWCRRER